MSLPEWLPLTEWNGYVEMRKAQKKVMTDRAEALRIKDLEVLHLAGHDVGAILDQSTANNWTDLYELKDKRTTAERKSSIPQLGKHGQATADNAKDWLDSQHGMPDSLEVKRAFATLLSGLADYYKQEISRAVLGLYWEGLRQFDYAAIEKACWAHTQNPDTGMFMPRTADLIKMLQGRTDDQAKIAWAKVDRAARSSPGVYETVAFDDPLIHRVLADMGGWASFGNKAEDEWPFVAKEFETRYRGYRMRGVQPEYPNKLIGVAESQNYSSGQMVKREVFLIGDSAKAIEVIKGGSTKALEKIGVFDMSSLNNTVPLAIQ